MLILAGTEFHSEIVDTGLIEFGDKLHHEIEIIFQGMRFSQQNDIVCFTFIDYILIRELPVFVEIIYLCLEALRRLCMQERRISDSEEKQDTASIYFHGDDSTHGT